MQVTTHSQSQKCARCGFKDDIMEKYLGEWLCQGCLIEALTAELDKLREGLGRLGLWCKDQEQVHPSMREVIQQLAALLEEK